MVRFCFDSNAESDFIIAINRRSLTAFFPRSGFGRFVIDAFIDLKAGHQRGFGFPCNQAGGIADRN